MNGKANGLVGLVAGASLALSSMGCSVLKGKQEQAPQPSAPASANVPSGTVDATVKTTESKPVDYVVRTYNVGSGRSLVLRYEPEAFAILNTILGESAYLSKPADGRAEVGFGSMADVDGNGIVTVPEIGVVKIQADLKLKSTVGTPSDYFK